MSAGIAPVATSERPTIGIFGGSFNPPHISHVLACAYALATWPLKKILVIPSFQHPFAKPLLSYQHRLEMTRLAMEPLGDRVDVSSVEERMGGVSYTIDTVERLMEEMPGCDFRVIVGSDIVKDAAKWKHHERLQQRAPMLVIPRLVETGGGPWEQEQPGYLPAVSSTTIRDVLSRGEEPGTAVPFRVLDYIRLHHLYTSVRD